MGIATQVRLTLSFLLSGLRWYLSGLSEIPLKQYLLLRVVLAGEYFSLFLLRSTAIFSHIFCFRAVYEHDVGHLLCIAVPQAQHSTAAKQVRADHSATTQASRQKASTRTVLQYLE